MRNQEEEYSRGWSDGHSHGKRYVAFRLDVGWSKDRQQGYKDGYKFGRNQ
jgi:hypothetical protein